MNRLGLPAEKVRALQLFTEGLRAIPNMAAVVLGGSSARRVARPDSDLDIGLYYREALPFSVDHVQSVAKSICMPGSAPAVTKMYEWGPWVNGGAWIQTSVGKVDFLYRNLDQVRTVIEEGCRGAWHHDYDQQPPYGFRSIIYFGEIYFCVPMHDPDGAIARLKQSVAWYPEALRSRIIQDTLWGAEFSLQFCRTLSAAADVYNTVGCLTRIAQYLVQALFALNREYFIGDKYACRLIEQFKLRPRDFSARMERVLSDCGKKPAQLSKSTEQLSALWHETVELAGAAYKPSSPL